MTADASKSEPRIVFSGLTTEELKVCEILADAFIAFAQLPTYHPDDRVDFTAMIHASQNIVMARAAVRAHPTVFHMGPERITPA